MRRGFTRNGLCKLPEDGSFVKTIRKKMKPIILLVILWALTFPDGIAGEPVPVDSVQNIKSSSSKLAIRLHSKGQFTYGGRIVSENPVDPVFGLRFQNQVGKKGAVVNGQFF